MRSYLLRSLGVLAVATLAIAAVPVRRATAQEAVVEARDATREELRTALAMLEGSAGSPAYSDRLRQRARQRAAAVRERLTRGDFRIGDQVRLRVIGPTPLVDSVLTVTDSLVLHVPGVRDVRLHGVLRSELTEHLVRDLSEVVRDVRVFAQPMIRVAVVGQVAQPGFLAVTEETLVDQLITQAGGPTTGSALGSIRLTRGDTTLLAGSEVSAAIASGRTLRDLGLRDGDTFVIPQASAPWDRTAVLQIVTLFVGPILTLLAVR